MRGLLVKDFKLFSEQKQFFALILFIAAALVVTGQNPHFIISYCTLICTFFTISTIGYDEFGNGYAFLFTLPVSRKGYAIEKYLFGTLMGGGTWLAATVVCAAYTWMKEPNINKTEWFLTAFCILLCVEIMISLMVPIQLKFGSEKSRIATFVITILFFVMLEVLKQIQKLLGIQWNVGMLQGLGMIGGIILGMVCIIAVIAASVIISIRIVEKKQF